MFRYALFYSVFKDSVPVNLYAYGAAGYGTTQELLAIEKYIDSIKPKWVIVQTCANDYIDNYWMMEMHSGYKVSQTRPYLCAGGKIEYHYPRPWYEHVKDYSLFINFILERSRQALINVGLLHPSPSTEVMVEAKGKDYSPYAISCQITENALRAIKQISEKHNAKLLVYILGGLDQKKNAMNDIAGICKNNGIDIITGAVEKVEEAENKGAVLRSFDGYHFNPKGQKILSQILIDYFRLHELTNDGKPN